MQPFPVLLLFLVLFTTTFPQNNPITAEYRKHIQTEINQDLISDVNTDGSIPPTIFGSVLTTNYDILGTSVVNQNIVQYNGVPYIALTTRDMGSSIRKVNYLFTENGNFTGVRLFDTTKTSSYSVIDLKRTGQNPGTILVNARNDNQNRAFIQYPDGTGNNIILPGSSLPAKVFWSGDNLFAVVCDVNDVYIYKSADAGTTYSLIDSLSRFTPSPVFYVSVSPEINIVKSPDEKHIAIINVNLGNGHVYSGVPESEADNVSIMYSADYGETWNAMTAAVDGKIGLVTAYPDYAPVFENFGQIHSTVDNQGVIHIVANGYGVLFDQQHQNIIGSLFPVLYWNSNVQSWKAISDEMIDALPESILANQRQGNNIGQSYPAITISEDGAFLYSVWTGPQLTGGRVDISNGYFLTDLYAAYSVDGGSNWHYKGVIAGKKEVSENFPMLSRFTLNINQNEEELFLTYLEDLEAGISVLGEGSATINPFIFERSVFDLTTASSGDEHTLADYSLMQNYPNPFNPVTNIRYTLSEPGEVKLVVYDMLGRTVAELVNGRKEAGTHDVQFDARDLTSGIYFYSLKSGAFNSVKKMVFLK